MDRLSSGKPPPLPICGTISPPSQIGFLMARRSQSPSAGFRLRRSLPSASAAPRSWTGWPDCGEFFRPAPSEAIPDPLWTTTGAIGENRDAGLTGSEPRYRFLSSSNPARLSFDGSRPRLFFSSYIDFQTRSFAHPSRSSSRRAFGGPASAPVGSSGQNFRSSRACARIWGRDAGLIRRGGRATMAVRRHAHPGHFCRECDDVFV